jgi:hypothetical protein
MPTAPVRLRVTIVTGHGDVPVLVAADRGDRISDLVARLVREFGLTGGPAVWQLVFTDRALPGDRTLRELVPTALDPVPLTLKLIGGGNPRPSGGPGGLAVPAAPASEPAPAPATPATGSRELAPPPTPTDRARAGGIERLPAGRRATVHYYSSMNANRVFPLMVTLARDEVARVVQQYVEQRGAGKLKLGADSPIEIEPVLPGCDVHPPRTVTRLGDADEVFRFHVVPHVVGRITGARVVIRQDHATLAEVELDTRVTQQTWVWLAGLATVALPVASSVMSHFGVDFQSTDGVRPVLATLRFLFSDLQPIVLAGLLAALTLGLWWAARPKPRDLFWDVCARPASA